MIKQSADREPYRGHDLITKEKVADFPGPQ